MARSTFPRCGRWRNGEDATAGITRRSASRNPSTTFPGSSWVVQSRRSAGGGSPIRTRWRKRSSRSATRSRTAAAVGFAFLLAVSISNDRRASVAAALVLAFGTLLWPYLEYGFNAPLVTLGLTVGVYGFVAGTMTASVPTLLLGGVGFGLALLTRHEMILASVVGIVWLLTEARQQRLDRRHVAARVGGDRRGIHRLGRAERRPLRQSVPDRPSSVVLVRRLPWLHHFALGCAAVVHTHRGRRSGCRVAQPATPVVSSPSCPCCGPRCLLRVARRLAGYAFGTARAISFRCFP